MIYLSGPGDVVAHPGLATAASATDEELWPLITAGHHGAFTALYERHAEAVWNYAYRLTASWSEADDLLSVVFLTAWRRRRDLRLVHGSALPWLYVVTTNVCRGERCRLARLFRALPRLLAASWPRSTHGRRDRGRRGSRRPPASSHTPYGSPPAGGGRDVGGRPRPRRLPGRRDAADRGPPCVAAGRRAGAQRQRTDPARPLSGPAGGLRPPRCSRSPQHAHGDGRRRRREQRSAQLRDPRVATVSISRPHRAPVTATVTGGTFILPDIGLNEGSGPDGDRSRITALDARGRSLGSALISS